MSAEGVPPVDRDLDLRIELDPGLKIQQCRGIDVEPPLEVGAHLPLHLVDLPKSEHTLTIVR